MAWIKLHSNLIRHRKLKKFARTLGVPHHVGAGHMLVFWSNVLEFSEDGNITKWDKSDIAEYGEWDGDPEVFYKALNEGDGFLDEKDGVIQVHDWWDYVGQYLTTKYRTNNPEKIKEIKSRYLVVKQSSKSLTLDNLDKIRLDKIYIQSSQPTVLASDLSSLINLFITLKDQTLLVSDNPAVFSSIYKRECKSAKELLGLGTLNTAEGCMKWCAEQDWAKKCDWHLSTVVKNYPKYLQTINTVERIYT
jgi:hypothetical protein